MCVFDYIRIVFNAPNYKSWTLLILWNWTRPLVVTKCTAICSGQLEEKQERAVKESFRDRCTTHSFPELFASLVCLQDLTSKRGHENTGSVHFHTDQLWILNHSDYKLTGLQYLWRTACSGDLPESDRGEGGGRVAAVYQGAVSFN